MAFCTSCGTKLPDGSRFCPSCGAAVAAVQPEQPVQSAQPMQPAQPEQPAQPAPPVQQAPQIPLTPEEKDVADNKAMAILAYLGLLVLVPIFAAKDSKFARFHANQGLVLMIASAAYGLTYGIIYAILYAVLWRAWTFVSIVTTLMGLASVVFLVLMILGIVNAAQGQKKPLPVIGSIRILK